MGEQTTPKTKELKLPSGAVATVKLKITAGLYDDANEIILAGQSYSVDMEKEKKEGKNEEVELKLQQLNVKVFYDAQRIITAGVVEKVVLKDGTKITPFGVEELRNLEDIRDSHRLKEYSYGIFQKAKLSLESKKK